jgi:hypothetical protein
MRNCLFYVIKGLLKENFGVDFEAGVGSNVFIYGVEICLES